MNDDLTVSSSAHLIAMARSKVDGIPDVRTEKVEALKAKLDSDAYHPDPNAVADGLMKEHMPVHRD